MALDVVAITGVGGMGIACARRLGSGNQLLLADVNAQSLDKAFAALRVEGFAVETLAVDVADAESVATFAKRAAELGFVRTFVHTAGLSPLMADAMRIYAVDLVGTANVLDAFSAHIGVGSVAVMIASIASHAFPRDAALEKQLATLPAKQLLDVARNFFADDPSMAYALSKLGNKVRVEETALTWGRHGARVVSVSPGIISTPMGRLENSSHPRVADLFDLIPMQRLGTAEDIATLVQWLASPAASYVSGTDIRIDGGLIPAMRNAGIAAN